MKQQLVEDYMSHKYWYIHGDDLPWIKDEDTSSGCQAYVGNITVACAAGDYDDDALDDATVEALAATKKCIVKIPNGWVGIEFRFRSDGNEDDDNVVQCFASAGVDYYRWIGQLTLTQGTLDHATGHFVDTITQGAAGLWPTTIKICTGSADMIAFWSMNTHGYDRWLFLMSTKDTNTTNLYVDFKQL